MLDKIIKTLFFSLLGLALLSDSVHLRAESAEYNDVIVEIWSEKGKVLIHDHVIEVSKIDQITKKVSSAIIPLGSDIVWSTICKGRFYILENQAPPIEPNGKTDSSPGGQTTPDRPRVDLMPTQRLLQSLDGKIWEIDSVVDSKLKICAIMPLDNGRFFAVSSSSFFYKPDSETASIFGILSRTDDNVLHLDKVIDMEIRPVLAKYNISSKEVDINPKTFGYLYGFHSRIPQTFILSNDRIVIYSKKSGHYWIFDTNSGAMVNRSSFFGGFSDNSINIKGGLPISFILGAQPQSDGNILFATRSLDAIAFAKEEFPMKYKDGKYISSEMISINLKELDKKYPDVWWWEMNPNSGAIHRQLNGPDLATKRCVTTIDNFHPFQILFDGSVDFEFK